MFDVANDGGRQAQSLRSRSFRIQILAEAAMLRVLHALEWRLDEHLMMASAGKFVLGGEPPEDIIGRLAAVRKQLESWLLSESGGELRLSLSASPQSGSEIEQYRDAARQLQHAKFRPWSAVGIQLDRWDTSSLQIAPLDTPCALCRHRSAATTETDADTGETRRICRRCENDREVGRQLPTAKWVILNERAVDGELGIFGYGAKLSHVGAPAIGPNTVALANLADSSVRPPNCPPEKFLQRPLTRHVPADEHGPIWFTELAPQATGAALLGVLKADVDSLGESFGRLGSMKLQKALSQLLESFFAGRLNAEIAADPRWKPSIYLVFSGGDDLLLTGPWNVVCDFAGHMRDLFRQQFAKFNLTFSAGFSLIKPKFPIKHAAQQADDLLEHAKTSAAPGESAPKDQMAACGQVWKWKHHDEIISTAKQLAEWVRAGAAQRGWLHTLLQFAEDRDPPQPGRNLSEAERAGLQKARQMAPARLAYHINRNYPKKNDRDSSKAACRRWADALLDDFESARHVTNRYLPAILRYALTATRTADKEP